MFRTKVIFRPGGIVVIHVVSGLILSAQDYLHPGPHLHQRGGRAYLGMSAYTHE